MSKVLLSAPQCEKCWWLSCFCCPTHPQVEEKDVVAKTSPAAQVPDAAGLALEAISNRARVAKNVTVADARVKQLQPVALVPPKQAAPVDPWQEATDAASGMKYYFNSSTGATSWTDPRVWAVAVDASSGKTYKYNRSAAGLWVVYPLSPPLSLHTSFLFFLAAPLGRQNGRSDSKANPSHWNRTPHVSSAPHEQDLPQWLVCAFVPLCKGRTGKI